MRQNNSMVNFTANQDGVLSININQEHSSEQKDENGKVAVFERNIDVVFVKARHVDCEQIIFVRFAYVCFHIVAVAGGLQHPVEHIEYVKRVSLC